MKRMTLKFLNCGVVAMLAILSSTSHAALEWVQIARVSGDTVCGSLETGIGDIDKPGFFHPYSKFMSGGNVNERLRVQRGSTIAVRLLGHGADVFPSLREEIPGVNGSITAQGRYFHHPKSSGPIGFVEVRISVLNDAKLGNNSVYVQWPTGQERIPLRIVQDCVHTQDAPTTAVRQDMKCFGAAGSNCGVPIGAFNPGAVCADGLCLYSGGSWTHDECCAKHSSGHACGGLETFVSGETLCRAEFDRALSRTANSLMWHRETDFTKVNTKGTVEFADACAPRGTIVHASDERFCCVKQGISRAPTVKERNKASLIPLVKGYATAGRAIPPGTVACD